ncbi:hypothetical protein NW064_01555 [Mycoplasmopsis felis]|nr:hypothetical protein [Mycoplasmopsis felis]UWW01090.1 hypothetical protein NW064_01555 [Mycoplasmopsis felis]
MKSKKSVGHILSIIGVCSAILFLFIFSFIKAQTIYMKNQSIHFLY